jgi:serine/threonine-protein kinase RsbW
MTGPLADPELELHVPPKPEYVRAVRHTVGALARLHGVPEDVVEDVKLAVSEATTSALLLNAALDPPEPVVVQASGGSDVMVVEVLDRGPAPARQVAGSPDELDTGDLPFEKLLSVPIVRGLVDEVALMPREGGGSTVHMTVSAQPTT